MRYALLVLALTSCIPSTNQGNTAFESEVRAKWAARDAEEKARGDKARAARAEAAERRRLKQEEGERQKVEQEEATKPKPVDCEGTRAARVSEAKDTIRTWNAHVEEIKPLVKWAVAHKCKLRDTTGSYLVKRTREAGGIRVEVKRGGPDEVTCDTGKIKPGVDATLLRELELLENTSDDDVMFETFPECDAKETPSLRFTYGDEAAQKAILGLP